MKYISLILFLGILFGQGKTFTFTEKEILDTIASFDRSITTFHVSHDHAALKYCDVIFEVKNLHVRKINIY